MQQIFTPDAMKAADRDASEHAFMPSLLLMENAGRCIIDDVEHAYGRLEGASVLVVCGKGNNGGDGLVAARHALMRGAAVTVLLLEPEAKLSEDAQTNLKIVKAGRYGSLIIASSLPRLKTKRHAFQFIIDAIFGTSFRGEVKGKYKTVIDWMNAQRAVRIAVDVPSGLDALTGGVATTAVRADRTVTLAALKPGFFLERGREFSGVVSVADISMPPTVLDAHSCRLYLVGRDEVRAALPVRPVTAHKYSIGKILAIAGSRGLTGAALLSSQSALRSGAGAVILCVPRSELGAVSRRTMEVMPFPVASNEDGSFALAAAHDLTRKLVWADVILLGPGIARQQETDILVRGLIASVKKPMVIDAGGISALSEQPLLLKERRALPTVLTPHVGEFSRLIGVPVKTIERNKIEMARSFAVEYGVVLVLKGAPTITAVPDGRVYVNTTGNAGMATAGSGDVLAGIIASLMGQRNDAVRAAVNGVYIHGLAGDMAAREQSEPAMIASDITRHLPGAFRSLSAG